MDAQRPAPATRPPRPRKPRVRLTDTRIEQFSPSGAEEWLKDTESRLAVRCRPGSKVFLFAATLRYRDIRITIGPVGRVSLADARAKAREWESYIARGLDPRDILRDQAAAAVAAQAAQTAALAAEKAAQEARQRYTLKALCEAYAAALESQRKAASAAQARTSFRLHVFDSDPAIAATPAAEITSRQVAALVRGVREQGKERAAGLLRAYLSAAYNMARRAPFDASLPAALIAFGVETNPVEPIRAIPVGQGTRRLTDAELCAYAGSLTDALPDHALRLALLAGGQRMDQLLRAETSDYDPQTKTLRLLDGKGRRRHPREHLLPLAPHAAALVESLIERAAALGSPLLFSTHGRVQMTRGTCGKRAAEISRALGGEPFAMRDIRRTCETLLVGRLGIHKDIRAQLLSHGISGVQAAHYDRHDYIAEKRAALLAWERWLSELQTGEPMTANVVALRAG